MSSSSVRLRWTGQDLIFAGGTDGGPEVTLDSAGAAGPSPTQMLLLSLAGCMGVDLVMILQKSRVPVRALDVIVEGERRSSEPRRFESMRLTYRVEGPEEEHRAKLERAVALSRDKYCSVLHTLRPDLELDLRIEPA